MSWPWSRRRRPGAAPPPADGQRTLLSILLPVTRPEGLVEAMHALPAGAASPFAGLPGTHNGRFTVLPHRQAAAGYCPMLALSATIDGDVSVWLSCLLDRLGPAVTEDVLGRCAGWPGRAQAVPWLQAHAVGPTLPFSTWEAPLTTTLRALARTDAIREFAVETQTMPATERHARFVERFGKVGR